MSTVKKALAHAEELKRKQELEEKRKADEAKNDQLNRDYCYKLMDDTLNEFDGVKGFRRDGNSLRQRGHKRVEMSVTWETWDNPNVDYKLEESAYGVRWAIFNDNGEKVISSHESYNMDSFAKYIAGYMT